MTAVIETRLTERQIAKLKYALEPMALLGWMKGVIEPYIQERARARFTSEGDDVSGKWAALSDATIDFRTTGQIDYGSGPINVRTGALEDYITNSNGGYFTTGGDAVMVYPGVAPSGTNATGTLLDKMTAAQQGLSDPYTPARPVLGVNEKDLAFALTAFEKYVAGV